MEPVVADVLAANQAFYDAHEGRDMRAMESIWEHTDRTVCVHPGWPILRTWPHIAESWRQIFAGPGRSQFILTGLSVAVDGDLAWVTLEENMVDVGRTGAIAATNLFARGPGGEWKLIVHHGSPIATA